MEVRELETNFGNSPDFARKLRKSKTACLWIQPTKRLLSNKKDENFGEWYSEVVVRGEMIKNHDILDCYILLSRTMCIWNTMKEFFNAQIKEMNIQEIIFPTVTSAALERDKDHIDGFSSEVAWVTKAGNSDLEVPVAIRPTRETIMYPYFSKKIRRYDLPLKVNQWCDVPWKFSNPIPFIRKLFHASFLSFIHMQACIPNTGCSIQGATSNCLGQLIDFENEKGENSMVWHNFWAYSTRTIGVMVMVHGDGRGLVLPPKVAPLQAIVIPLHYKDFDIQAIFDACNETVVTLTGAGLRVEADLRDNYSPGWKYSHWEMKGVPLRIEIGPKELVNNQVRFVRCDNFEKVDIPRNDLVNQVEDMLAKIQESMFDVAKVKHDACVKVAITWKEFMEALNQKKIIFAPWCDEKEVEEDVLTRTKGETGAAKLPCSPLNQPELPEGTLCFASEKPAKKWTYWGRSY